MQGKAEEGRSIGERDSSEDKSSSLDSNEDLDMAIMDLLRSNQKLKKSFRDTQAACRKKVRFSTSETQLVHKLEGLLRAWKDRGPGAEELPVHVQKGWQGVPGETTAACLH